MSTTPLTHLRVVECATFVAGPSCGMSLAQLGADVIRVDLPGGGNDHQRWPLAPDGTSLYWANLNKGKRSVAVDYRTQEGRELLLTLATRPGTGAGILIDNLVGRHRISHDDLTARRPDAISAHVLGFPDGRPAVDYTVNAEVGVPNLTGPSGAAAPVNHVLPAWDLLAGAQAATGILAAVTRRESTGTGSRIDIALSDVALSAVGAMGWLAEAEQSGDRAPHGNQLYGSFGTDFATADGRRVMVVALTPAQWQALCEITGTTAIFEALSTAFDTDLRQESARYELRETLASILRPWFAARTLDELTAELSGTRVLWSTYRSVSEAAARARADAQSVAKPIQQPGIGEMLATGHPLRWSDELAAPVPAPRLGADTEAVLAHELGMSALEIGQLHDRQVVACAPNQRNSTTATERNHP